MTRVPKYFTSAMPHFADTGVNLRTLALARRDLLLTDPPRDARLTAVLLHLDHTQPEDRLTHLDLCRKHGRECWAVTEIVEVGEQPRYYLHYSPPVDHPHLARPIVTRVPFVDLTDAPDATLRLLATV